LFGGVAVTELYNVAVVIGVPPTPMSFAPANAAAVAEAWSWLLTVRI
jgi:hypothetical protein